MTPVALSSNALLEVHLRVSAALMPVSTPSLSYSNTSGGLSHGGAMEDSTAAPLLQQSYEEKKCEARGFLTSERVKSIVYAGLDAILTSFSLISSISGGRLASVDVLVLGFANLVADGISMGFGDFVSSSTERDMTERERRAMEQGIRRHIRPQLSELLEAYQALGMDMADAATVVSVLSKYKDILVDEKMSIEKGMLPPRQIGEPWKSGLTTFLSFLVFGSAPLLAFIALIPFTDSDAVKFLGACLLSACALTLLGFANARISRQSYARSAATTLFNGCVAAAAAYAVGWTLRNVVGFEN